MYRSIGYSWYSTLPLTGEDTSSDSIVTSTPLPSLRNSLPAWSCAAANGFFLTLVCNQLLSKCRSVLGASEDRNTVSFTLSLVIYMLLIIPFTLVVQVYLTAYIEQEYKDTVLCYLSSSGSGSASSLSLVLCVPLTTARATVDKKLTIVFYSM